MTTRVASTWLLLLAAVTGCASNAAIKRALLSDHSGACPDAKAVDSGKKDCDGLPIYQLWCGGQSVREDAIWCHKGDCYTQQMAGRCWK